MTLSRPEVLLHLRKTGVVPVLRADSEDEALRLVKAITAGGVNVIELTMTVPGALPLLLRLAHAYPDVLLGAGTVLDPETARLCILEGAQFIVSPALNLRTVELCRRYSVAVLPGALTPTEVVNAWQAGADAIKVFPANAMGGASYLRSLKAPLPQVELLPTGGVSLHTALDFLRAGALALGVGADLVDVAAIHAGHPEHITAKARQYVDIVRQFHASAEHGQAAAAEASPRKRKCVDGKESV